MVAHLLPTSHPPLPITDLTKNFSAGCLIYGTQICSGMDSCSLEQVSRACEHCTDSHNSSQAYIGLVAFAPSENLGHAEKQLPNQEGKPLTASWSCALAH